MVGHSLLFIDKKYLACLNVWVQWNCSISRKIIINVHQSNSNVWNSLKQSRLRTKHKCTPHFEHVTFVLDLHSSFLQRLAYSFVSYLGKWCLPSYRTEFFGRFSFLKQVDSLKFSSWFSIIKIWKFSKQFRVRVRHKWISHFVHVTFVLNLHSSFLQRLAYLFVSYRGKWCLSSYRREFLGRFSFLERVNSLNFTSRFFFVNIFGAILGTAPLSLYRRAFFNLLLFVELSGFPRFSYFLSSFWTLDFFSGYAQMQESDTISNPFGCSVDGFSWSLHVLAIPKAWKIFLYLATLRLLESNGKYITNRLKIANKRLRLGFWIVLCRFSSSLWKNL